MTIPWVTVWGFGAEIKSTKDSLLVRQDGKVTRYPFDEVSHLLIAGGHSLNTAVLERLAERRIPVSFFDVHGKPVGGLYGEGGPRLSAAQREIPVHKFAMATIQDSLGERMRFLNELAESDPSGLFYKGELDILNAARDELNFLVTLPEIGRVFSFTKAMYYEILSRAVPQTLGYRRRVLPPYLDPVNAMFSHGYAVLYATFTLACTGAGLDLSRGALYGVVEPVPGGGGACVLDLMEPAMVPMVDRVIVKMAAGGALEGRYEAAGRCILSEELKTEFTSRLHEAINPALIEENVQRYAGAVKNGGDVVLHY